MSLITNEMMKLFKKSSTYIIIAILTLIVLGVGGITKYIDNLGSTETTNVDWQQQLTEQIQMNKQELEMVEEGQYANMLKRDIAIAEYQLTNNMAPVTESSIWSFTNNMVESIGFISIFTIIVAAGIVAHEFSTGTIKLLLIRPVSRFKILCSKYVTVLLFSAILLLFTFVLSLVVGGIFFGFDDVGPKLVFDDGQVKEVSQIGYAFFTFMLNSVGLLMLTTMAFMISTAFRNSSLAIGISIFLLLMGGNLSLILGAYFDWAKYILFLNLDLLSYFNGNPPIEGMTLPFSITVLIVYFIAFHAIALLFFTKRDVRA